MKTLQAPCTKKKERIPEEKIAKIMDMLYRDAKASGEIKTFHSIEEMMEDLMN